MQNLDVISVNLWQMLASLANLVILFLIVKKFLYKPVKKMLAQRQNSIDSQYNAASEAEQKAILNKETYENLLLGAKSEADDIIKNAVENASSKEKSILDEAKTKAEGIIKRAEADAILERKKARDDIKREIVDVSTLLSEKMLEREISSADHEQLISSFIEKIGENNEAN